MDTKERVRIIGNTESVCPRCLKRIAAKRVAVGDDVFLDKVCPEHGSFRTIIWRGQQPSYESWGGAKQAATPPVCATQVQRGCPYDCGLCPEHRQHSCCVLLEVTSRCNLACPTCFAQSGGSETEPDMEKIESWYKMLLASGGPYNIQLSGGEPTMRQDLTEIVAMGRSLGFEFIQLNTNGIKLAQNAEYAHKLKQAGLGCVFLQFDGTEQAIYEKIRGARLFETKKAAIANCAAAELGVVLVPTLIPGVNVDNIGGILDYAVKMMPAVRGVHFQPVSYFGRYSQQPVDANRITIPEVLNGIELQTAGKMRVQDFFPPSGENAYCSFHGNFTLMRDGQLKPWAKAQQSCCCQPDTAAEGAKKAQAFVARRWTRSNRSGVRSTNKSINDLNIDSLDDFLDRMEDYSLAVSGMVFQDAWTLDLDRLKECFIHVASNDNKIIPFCAYNVTDVYGNSLYRPAGRCR